MDNGAVVCGFHHTLIHQGDWTMRMGKDGHPEVIPPTWIDPNAAQLSRSHEADIGALQS